MSLKALDVASDTAGRAHQIAALGYQAVGHYLRADRCSLAMVKGQEAAKIRRFSIWEKGFANSAAYFQQGAPKGRADAIAAVAFAEHIGAPKGIQIFYCVDYDAAPSDLDSFVKDYMAGAQLATKAGGYLASVYGSGLTCQAMIDAGHAHSGFLAMSTGWGGYQEFKRKAAILQTGSATVAGFSVDTDIIFDEGVCW